MSSFLDEVADYVVSQGVVASAAMKVNKHPPSPDNCVTFLGLPGNALGLQRDVPQLVFPRWQAIIRNTNRQNGAEQLRTLRELLHGQINLILPHYRVLRIHTEQEGGPIGEDGQGRFEYSINFIAEYHYCETDSCQ